MVQKGFLARFFRHGRLAALTGLLPSLELRTETEQTANYRRLLGFVFRFSFSQAKEFVMSNLTDASRELFKRQPDECFPSLTSLREHCRRQKEACVDRWVPPRSIQTNPVAAVVVGRLTLAAGDDGAFEMNDWSFGQLCLLRNRCLRANNTPSVPSPHQVANLMVTSFLLLEIGEWKSASKMGSPALLVKRDPTIIAAGRCLFAGSRARTGLWLLLCVRHGCERLPRTCGTCSSTKLH